MGLGLSGPTLAVVLYVGRFTILRAGGDPSSSVAMRTTFTRVNAHEDSPAHTPSPVRGSSRITHSRHEARRRVRVDRIKEQVNKHLEDWEEEPLRPHELSATLRGYESRVLQWRMEACASAARGIVRGLTMAAAFVAGIVTVGVALGGTVAPGEADGIVPILTQLFFSILGTLGMAMVGPLLAVQILRRKAVILSVAQSTSERRASAPISTVATPTLQEKHQAHRMRRSALRIVRMIVTVKR